MHGPGQTLPHAARRFGDRVALVTATRALRYRELDEDSDRVASRGPRSMGRDRHVSVTDPDAGARSRSGWRRCATGCAASCCHHDALSAFFLFFSVDSSSNVMLATYHRRCSARRSVLPTSPGWTSRFLPSSRGRRRCSGIPPGSRSDEAMRGQEQLSLITAERSGVAAVCHLAGRAIRLTARRRRR